MPRRKVNVSIIIVYYQVKKELFDLLASFERSKPKAVLEIIVVDNDETKTIREALRNRFPTVRYIASSGNIGYGAGNNLGAQVARGEFLFFLNPDTIVFPGTVDGLVKLLKADRDVAVAAPLLLQKDRSPYEIQGSRSLNPWTALFVLTFINKYFPNNPVSQKFFLRDWDKKEVIGVDAVPGSAFVIRRSMFEQIGGFDENIFLFFEEYDLGRRLKLAGYKLFINPKARVIHLGGGSTQNNKETDRIFKESRFYYFRKHFGFLPAFIVEIVC